MNELNEETNELEIDWMELAAKLVRKWRFILLVSIIFGAVGIVAALVQPRIYSVEMTLAPEVPDGTSSSLGSISSMLGLGGLTAGASTDALNITLFPEICKSTPFLTELFPVPLTTFVSAKDAKNGVRPKQVTVFEHMTGLDKPQRGLSHWLKKVLGKEEEPVDQTRVNPSRLTRKQALAVTALSKSISANVNNKTGITTISVVMDDRLMVTQLADTVCRRLQEYVTMYRTQKYIEDYNYYVKMTEDAQERLIKAQAAYAASVDHERNLILQSVTSRRDRLRQEAELASQLYSQMAQQQEIARAKIQEVKPVFAVIQPATMPQHPANSRRKTVMIWGVLGFLLSCVWVAFAQDALVHFRDEVKNRLNKQQ